MTRQDAFCSSPTNPGLKEIQTIPERKADMPYAPAIRVESLGDLLFISEASARRPRWRSLSMSSTACWNWDVRTLSASPDRRQGLECRVRPADPRNNATEVMKAQPLA